MEETKIELDFDCRTGTSLMATMADWHLTGKLGGSRRSFSIGELLQGRQGWRVDELPTGISRTGRFPRLSALCMAVFPMRRQTRLATICVSQRLVDHGHHLFRYYVSGDAEFDNRFLTDMFSRFGEKIRLEQIDFSGRFSDWQTVVRYADVLRHHAPFHFEQSSCNLRVCAEFTKRVDLPVSLHTSSLERGLESIERGACTAFNLCNVDCGPTYIRKLYALAESAGVYCIIGTDQESTLGIAGQLHLGASVPNLSLPCDPMGPMLTPLHLQRSASMPRALISPFPKARAWA